MLSSGSKQASGHNNNKNLEDQVNHDASYQRTVKGQRPAGPNKETLTLQGTIGSPGCRHLLKQCRARAMLKSPASCLTCELNDAVECAELVNTVD